MALNAMRDGALQHGKTQSENVNGAAVILNQKNGIKHAAVKIAQNITIK